MAGHVLIIEDNPDTNELLASVVGCRGFEAVRAYGGQEGLELAYQHPPDLILLDLMLPDMDGFGVCEALRVQRGTNLIPVVMVTALTDAEDQVRGFRVGADEYVTKPFTADALLAAIDRAMHKQQRLRESGARGQITFDVERQPDALREVHDLLSALFLLTPLDEQQVSGLRDMLLRVADQTGPAAAPASRITVSYRVDQDKVALTFRDETRPLREGADSPTDPAARAILGDAASIFIDEMGILSHPEWVDEGVYTDQGHQVTFFKYFRRDKTEG